MHNLVLPGVVGILAVGSAALAYTGYKLHERVEAQDDRLAVLSEVILQNGRQDQFAGTVAASDALRLNDADDAGFLEIGRYNYGWTLLTPYRLEMHPGEEFSISCYGNGCLPAFQVRNIGDTEGAVWINGNGIIGSQFGPLKFAFGSFVDGGAEIARFEQNGNFVLNHDLIFNGVSLSETLEELSKVAGAPETPAL